MDVSGASSRKAGLGASAGFLLGALPLSVLSPLQEGCLGWTPIGLHCLAYRVTTHT